MRVWWFEWASEHLVTLGGTVWEAEAWPPGGSMSLGTGFKSTRPHTTFSAVCFVIAIEDVSFQLPVLPPCLTLDRLPSLEPYTK